MNQEQLKQQIIKKCVATYKNNLNALKKYDGELYKKVVKYQLKNTYRMIPNTDNKTFNIYIDSLDKNFYPDKEPLFAIKEHIDQLNLKNPGLAVFLGFGLGYEVIYFIQEYAAKLFNKCIIIFERDMELFINALHTTDIKDMIKNNKITFIVDESVEESFPLLSQVAKGVNVITNMKALEVLYYPTSLEMNKQYYFDMLAKLKEALLFNLSFYGNSPEDSLIGEENMFKNLNEIIEHPGINTLYNAFKGKPAVVVASGPSLKKNMHLIDGLQDKALILSAESTFTILGNEGIRPHIVASLERTMRTKSVFEGFTPEFVKDTYLAACPVIPKEAYEVYDGPRLVAYRHFDHFRWLNIDKGMLEIKHSSANMAYKIAAALGCDPIILVGQDLAFSREDHSTHAGNHVKGNKQDRYYKDAKITVKGNDGQPIETCESWFKFLKAYDIDVTNYKGKTINATEGGAYIQGTEVMSFQEAIDQYITEPIHPLEIIEARTKTHKESDHTETYRTLLGRVTKAIQDLKEMADMCDSGQASVEEHRDELKTFIEKDELTKEDRKRIRKISEAIFKYRMDIQQHSDTFQLLVMHVVQPIYIKLDIDMNERPSLYNDYYQGIADKCFYVERWFDVIKRLLAEIQKILIDTESDIQEKLKEA